MKPCMWSAAPSSAIRDLSFLRFFTTNSKMMWDTNLFIIYIYIATMFQAELVNGHQLALEEYLRQIFFTSVQNTSNYFFDSL